MFRGREMQHPELGRKILDQVAEEADDISKVEVYPKLDGRNMVMVLVPDREKQALAAKAAEEAAALEASEQAASETAEGAPPAPAAEAPAADVAPAESSDEAGVADS